MENDSFPQFTDAAQHIDALTRREALVNYVLNISNLVAELRSHESSPEYLLRLMNIACCKDTEMEGFPPEYQQEVQDVLASVLNADFILSISGQDQPSILCWLCWRSC